MGRAEDLRPPAGFPRLSAPPPQVLPSPAFLRLLLLCFLEFLGLAAFHVAFIFVIPTFATTSACYPAAEMVLVLHLLTIFIFLLALQLQHASTLPITVGRVAGSTPIVRNTTVEKVRSPFTL